MRCIYTIGPSNNTRRLLSGSGLNKWCYNVRGSTAYLSTKRSLETKIASYTFTITLYTFEIKGKVVSCRLSVSGVFLYFCLRRSYILGGIQQLCGPNFTEFRPLLPLSGQTWTFYLISTLCHMTPHGLPTDPPTPSFCPRSYWMTHKLNQKHHH